MPLPAPGYSIQTEGLVALAAAATAKTILSAIAGTGKSLIVCEFGIAFDGTTATEKPILVELCRSTQGAVGTSTSVTLRQNRGDGSYSPSSTGAKNFSAEPTTLTPIREYSLDPYKPEFVFPWPLGREMHPAIAGAICLRCTIPSGGAAVNARAYFDIEE